MVGIVGRIDQDAARAQPIGGGDIAVRDDGEARRLIRFIDDARAGPFEQAALGLGRLPFARQDDRAARQPKEDGQTVHQSASQSGMMSPSISALSGGRSRTTAHLSPATSTSGVNGRLL